MKIVFLLLFLAVSAVHLWGSYRRDAKIRAWTKGFILLFLTGYYFFSAESPNPLVLAALGTCWLGDVLLIQKGARWFIAGGISFQLSHILFLCAFFPHIDFSRLSVPFISAVSLAYIVAVSVIFKVLSGRIPKKLFIPMFGYLLTNACMNMFALMMFLSKLDHSSGIIFAGALLFFISDSILFFVHFHKKSEAQKSHFAVMATYISAEFLIAEGMAIL